MYKEREKTQEADVCLLLEGTYPYVTGGVSSWIHKLIGSLQEFTFQLVCILPANAKTELHYELPENVIGIKNLFLQNLPKGKIFISKKKRDSFFRKIEPALLNLQYNARLVDLKAILEAIDQVEIPIGSSFLLDSEDSWKMLLRMYRSTVGGGSFLNYFWSWRNLLSGFYSIILSPLPPAKVYHALCTGYAGLFLTRAHLENGKACLLTEHGIYANERRIEIIAADWLKEEKSQDLNIYHPKWDRDIKDYWIDTFLGYSKLCYSACDQIVTLYEGNRKSEIDDGANPEKVKIVPNGINIEKFSTIKRSHNHPPTVALIGRVVPIKDIKTFIHAAQMLIERIPDIRVWIIGPTDEDEPYYFECKELVQKNKLEGHITFFGKVSIFDYLPEIDVLTLTSISEAQPLVILEAGTIGIPAVATDVGSCRELIFGKSDELPPLGPGGEICSLSAPMEVSDSICRLLLDKAYYAKCSKGIKARVHKYYNIVDQDNQYRELYTTLMDKKWPV